MRRKGLASPLCDPGTSQRVWPDRRDQDTWTGCKHPWGGEGQRSLEQRGPRVTNRWTEQLNAKTSWWGVCGLLTNSPTLSPGLTAEQLLCIRPSVEQRSMEPITWPPTTTTLGYLSRGTPSRTSGTGRARHGDQVADVFWEVVLISCKKTPFPLRRKTKSKKRS